MTGFDMASAVDRLLSVPLPMVVAQQPLIDAIANAFPDYPRRLLIASALVPDNQIFFCPDEEPR